MTPSLIPSLRSVLIGLPLLLLLQNPLPLDTDRWEMKNDRSISPIYRPIFTPKGGRITYDEILGYLFGHAFRRLRVAFGLAPVGQGTRARSDARLCCRRYERAQCLSGDSIPPLRRYHGDHEGVAHDQESGGGK